VNTCQRCHVTDRPDRLRWSLVNRLRESIHDGRPHEGPAYDHQVRCRDKAACEERVRHQREIE
jgi:hypothetical protein